MYLEKLPKSPTPLNLELYLNRQDEAPITLDIFLNVGVLGSLDAPDSGLKS